MTNKGRGGIGFGGQDDYDDWDDDDEVEATRAMEIVDDDDFPPATRAIEAAPPAPDRPKPAPPRRASARPRPIEMADTMGEEEGEEATRMLDAADLAQAFGEPAPEPEPEMTRMEMRVISGPDRGKHHVVRQGDHLVGRGLDCQIVLADPAVSRKHFRLVRTGDTVETIDMGGANGTNVNGGRVSRQRLDNGDQIEVGTTVLEFWIDGAAQPGRDDSFKGAGSGAAESGGAAPSERPKMGMIIGLIAAGLLVLVGGGVAAYLVIGGDDGKDEAKEEAPEDERVAKIIKQAKGMLEDGEWSEAVDKLKEAKKIVPKDPTVRGLLSKAMDEVEYHETLVDGRSAMKDKHFASAISKFKEIPQTSEQYDDAREELAAALEDMASAGLDEAKKAIEAGEQDKAKAALKAILKIDAKNSEAKLMLTELESGGEGEEGGDKKEGVAGAKKNDTKGKAKAIPGQSAKTLMKMGLKAYHNRQWSEAQRAFSTIADGGYDKKSRGKARVYLGAVKEVATGFAAAETVNRPVQLARAYKKAYAADRRIDGHFGPTLVRKLVAAYVDAGKALFKRHQYPAAASAVREAMNYDPDNSQAQKLDEACIKQAGKMLQKAKEHMNRKNYATARDLAGQVTQILPGMDPRAAQAREIRKKASEASIQGDDD